MKAQVWATSYGKFVAKKGTTSHVPSKTYMQLYQVAENKAKLKHDLVMYIQHVEKIRRDTFDRYVKRRFGFWTLKEMGQSASEFIHYSCSCPFFGKYAVCKHAVGLGLLRKKFKIPKSKNISILMARKRKGACGGAPKKAGNCLAVDLGVTNTRSKRKSHK